MRIIVLAVITLAVVVAFAQDIKVSPGSGPRFDASRVRYTETGNSSPLTFDEYQKHATARKTGAGTRADFGAATSTPGYPAGVVPDRGKYTSHTSTDGEGGMIRQWCDCWGNTVAIQHIKAHERVQDAQIKYLINNPLGGTNESHLRASEALQGMGYRTRGQIFEEADGRYEQKHKESANLGLILISIVALAIIAMVIIRSRIEED